MCVVIMDATSTHSKSDCLRRTTKPGASLRWRLLRVSAEVKEGAHRVTDRRRCRREQQQQKHQRRLQAANVAAFIGGLEGKKKRKQAARGENPSAACVQRHPAAACVQSHPAEACVQRHPAGAMAPQNTTQYLMTNTYEDLQRCFDDSASQEANVNGKCLPDRGDSTAQDSDFDRYLAFLQKDFEEAVSGLCW